MGLFDKIKGATEGIFSKKHTTKQMSRSRFVLNVARRCKKALVFALSADLR